MIKCNIIIDNSDIQESEKPVRASLITLIKEVVDDLNNLLSATSSDPFSIGKQVQLKIILEKIIARLIKIRTATYDAQIETGSRMILDRAFALQQMQRPARKSTEEEIRLAEINNAVIDEFKKLQFYPGVNAIHVLKLWSLFAVPGVVRIEFTYDYKVINHETLLDIECPIDLVPAEFTCAILGIIMYDPIEAAPDTMIDRVVTAHHTSNPYNRQPWDQSTPTNSGLQSKIALFVRKVEWLYITFQEDRKYKELYKNAAVIAMVQDNQLSYAAFVAKADEIRAMLAAQPVPAVESSLAIDSTSTQFVLFGVDKLPANPPKYIYDLFIEYAMHVSVRPSIRDYETLLRKVSARGDVKNLKLLLDSPSFQSLEANLYSLNSKGQNVLDIIGLYKSKHPDLNFKYAECESLLAAYQKPTEEDIPSMARGLYRTRTWILPYFNRRNVVLGVVALGASVLLANNLPSDANTSGIKPTVG